MLTQVSPNVIPTLKVKTIIYADDHPIVAKGVEYFLNGLIDYSLINVVNDGAAAWKLIKAKKPDIAILDVKMPGLDAFEIAYNIKKEEIPTKVLFLSSFLCKDMIKSGLHLGVKGFLSKESALTEIEEGLSVVIKGAVFMSKCLLEEHRDNDSNISHHDELHPLTKKEKAILKLIAEGKTTNQISDILGSKPRTISNHRNNICRKLGLSGGKNSLMTFALQNQHLL